MTEKNRDTLRAALRRLPEYAAPASGWNDISRALPSALGERLPSYAPPTGVWNAISRELASETAPVARSAAIRRLWPRLGSIAAGLLALLTATALLLRPGEGTPRVSYAYSQEVSPPAGTADWDDRESSFTRVRADIAARDEPILNTLALELDELTTAKEEIKAMLVAYGDDPNIIRQLAEIERDRSDVYRRIIVEL